VRTGWVVLASLVLVAGCTSDDESSRPSDANALQVTRGDGSHVEFPPKLQVWCGPVGDLEDGGSGTALHLVGGSLPRDDVENPPSFWTLSRTRAGIEEHPELELPERGLGGPVLFVYDGETQNELASHQEEAEGTIAVEGWPGCRKGERVRIVVDATLGSEFSDMPDAKVEGEIVAVIGDRLDVPD
jgi:hypothetical protein